MPCTGAYNEYSQHVSNGEIIKTFIRLLPVSAMIQKKGKNDLNWTVGNKDKFPHVVSHKY